MTTPHLIAEIREKRISPLLFHKYTAKNHGIPVIVCGDCRAKREGDRFWGNSICEKCGNMSAIFLAPEYHYYLGRKAELLREKGK
jgi:hypothetical protein